MIFRTGILAAAVFATAAGMGQGHAQEGVGGPVRFVVPYGTGGGTDSIARIVAPELSQRIGVPVIVENRPGAGGILGSSAVANAEPDGQTLLFTAGIFVQAPALYKELPFDVVADFEPVSVLGRGPLVLVGRGDLPGGSLEGFIEEARKTPGEYNYASVAVASTSHLYGEQFNRQAGIELAHIPYNGGGAALAALLAGEMDVAWLDYPLASPHFESGKLKALGINGTERIGQGDMPTLLEQGLDGFESVGFYGVLAPAGTPEAIVSQLSEALAELTQMPEMQATFLNQFYLEPWGSTPGEFAEMIQQDLPAWAEIVESANVTLD